MTKEEVHRVGRGGKGRGRRGYVYNDLKMEGPGKGGEGSGK